MFGTVWAYRMLRDTGERHRGRIDWWGNVTFAVGLRRGARRASPTASSPYGGHSDGLDQPGGLRLLLGGVALLAAFVVIEGRVAEPMFDRRAVPDPRVRRRQRRRAAAAIARGGLQFMLIIWLQGIWLPLHGYDFSATPLWAGIYLLPMTGGVPGRRPGLRGAVRPVRRARLRHRRAWLVFAASFVGLLLLPVDFPYPAFALLIVLNGIGVGMFAAPNSSAIMGSVPARHRGAASGMRSTFQNSGTALSIGVFFSLMIAGLAGQPARARSPAA